MLILLTVFGGLGLFLFGIAVMSEGLQKTTGNRLRSVLRTMTSNRFAGVFTGFGVTAVIQSSSATTVMVVTFVNAGLLTLQQSISVIMGANIGTTVTGWLVALIGFKMKITLLALVAIGLGFIIKLYGRKEMQYWGEVLLGFGAIFIGLDFMKDAMGGLKGSEMITAWMSRFPADTIPNILLVTAVGAAVTMVIQSSSATMALTMTLAAQGLITFPTAAALILGENIGTTITANIAALGASRFAKRAALAHMIFNIIGVIWITLIFHQAVGLVDFLVPGDPHDPAAIPAHMAMFHTLFNITNTLIFLPFVTTLTKLVSSILPTKTQEKGKLAYLNPGMIATPSLALESTRMELNKMVINVQMMLKDIVAILHAPEVNMDELGKEIIRIEEETDHQKELITVFLRSIITRASSKAEGIEVTRILAHTSDLERIGDHCRNILKRFKEIKNKEIPLSDEAKNDLDTITKLVGEFLDLIGDGLKKPGRNIMEQAQKMELEIDSLRAKSSLNHQRRLQSGSCDIGIGLIFLDLLGDFEKIGDHAFNIAQRVSGVR